MVGGREECARVGGREGCERVRLEKEKGCEGKGVSGVAGSGVGFEGAESEERRGCTTRI